MLHRIYREEEKADLSMAHLANVLIAAKDTAYAATLKERLGRNGYRGNVAGSARSALRMAKEEAPDILLIGPNLPDMEGVDLVERIKTDPTLRDIPVLLVTTQPIAEIGRRALETGADDVILAPFDHAVLLARIQPLVRLATMWAELKHRAAAASRFGQCVAAEIPPPRIETRYPLLVVGDPNGEIQEILADGADLSVTDNLYEAEDMLTRRNFDAAVLVVDGKPQDYYSLCSQARNNPRLFNLPMLLVNDGGIETGEGYRHGASSVLPRPVDAAVLRNTVLTLVRRQRLRREVRDRLQETLRTATRDQATGLYSRAFLRTYLDGRLADAQRSHRHLSIIFFYTPNVEGVRQNFGEEAAAHLLVQLGQWIAGLLRVEDLVALYGSNEFCVVLPDTPLDEAAVVMHRIAGVLTYTDFAVKDVYQPIRAWVQVGSADVQPDDDVASVLARARSYLE